jgi:hypothetical protein
MVKSSLEYLVQCTPELRLAQPFEPALKERHPALIDRMYVH